MAGTRLGRGCIQDGAHAAIRASAMGAFFRGCRRPRSLTHCYLLPFVTACFRKSFIFLSSEAAKFPNAPCFAALDGVLFRARSSPREGSLWSTDASVANELRI